MKAINKHDQLVVYGNESVQDVRKTGYPNLLRQAAKAQSRSNFINPIQVNDPNSHSNRKMTSGREKLQKANGIFKYPSKVN